MFCLSGLFVLLLARSLVFAGPVDLENGTPRGQTSLKKGDVVMLKPQDVTPPIKRIDGSPGNRIHPAVITHVSDYRPEDDSHLFHVAIVSHGHPIGTPTKPESEYGFQGTGHMRLSPPAKIPSYQTKLPTGEPKKLTEENFRKLRSDLYENKHHKPGDSSSQNPQSTSRRPVTNSGPSTPSVKTQQNTSRVPATKSDPDGWHIVQNKKGKK